MSIETLDVASTLNVVQDEYGSNKYVLNGNTTYDSNNKYTLQIGTYQLTGIPSSHPLAIVDITDSNQVSYTGLLANKTTVSGVDYYVGDITINVIGNFGTASIKCSNHGYMGGQDLLQYVADVVINPDNGNISYANSGVSTSNKITKKYYKDLKGNSDIFFNERVRIKSNNIICSNSDKTVDIQHTQNDQIYIIGSKQSNGSSVLSHSNNGKTWNPIPLTINGTTIFTHVRGVAYSPESELWIACGSGNNTLAYSIDGIQWTGLGKTIFGDVAYSVAYANGKWIAVGGNTPNTIAYSSNGVSWTGVGTSIFTNCGKAIGYGNGIWVAGGQGTNTMAYSVDGINWTGLGDTIFDEQCNVVKYADSKWVAGGGKDIPNTLAYSTDGINWTGKRYNNIRNYTYGIDYANGLWIAGGGQKDEGYVGGNPRNWVLVSDTITDWNGGFELPVVGYYDKLENFGTNFSIPGWSWAVGTPGYEANKGPSFGRNPSNGTPIPGSGYQTIGLRYGHSLSKTISGILHHGSVYQIKLMAVTQYGKYDQSLSSPTIKVYYNGTEISEFTFRMMDGDLPVLVDNILFTASGNNHEIIFEHQGVDNYTMLMDDIQLFEDTLSYLDISASDLSGIDISAANVGTDLSNTSWTLESATMVNWNGGFEADALDVNHFVKMGRDDPFGGVLTGWTYTKGTHSSWGPTLINGNNSGFGNQAIIHGTQIIGLRYGQTLSKSLVGLTTGKTYKLRYQRHARVAQTGIEYRVYLNDTTNILKQETVTTAASEVEANRLVEIDFTAPDSSATLTLEQLTGGDEMVWFDKFELYLDKSSGTFDTTSAINSIEWYLKSDSITNWNGSFETDAVAIGDYYIVGSTANGSNNGPATLTGWTQETTNESYGAILVNKYSSQMYDNTQYNGGLTNGAVIQGNQAVGLHMGTKLKKTINDLTAGTDYKISFEVFKFDKSQGQVNYSVQLDSAATTLLLTTEITNGETSTISERTRTVEFKATQTSHTIIFVADSGTTWNMFFLDNVKLFQKMSGISIDFGSISKIPSGTIGQETADDNAFDNNWTTNYHNTIMLSLDFNTVFAGEGLSIALAGDAGISSNYAPNTGPLQWHFNVDAVSAGWQSNQTLIPGVYNATYSFVLPNTTYTKALGVGADGDKGVIISKTFSASSKVKVVYGYGRIDSTTGADLGGSGDGASAVITVAGIEIDSTTEAQKTVTFEVNSGETMEIKGSLLLYALEDFPNLSLATHSFILTGASRSLTDINNSNIALELFGNPTFGTDGVELTDTTSKYIKVPQSILMFGSNDFTVSVSIKDAVYTGNTSAWILGFGVNYHVVHDYIGRYFFLGYKSSYNGGVYFRDRLGVQDGVSSSTHIFDNIYGSDSAEHTFTVSRKDGNMYVFIDNELKITPYAQPGPLRQDDQNFIGGGYQSNSISRPITGKITKFEVWDSVGFDTWPPAAPDTPIESSGSGSTGGVSVETPPTWSLISDSISDWNGGFEDDALSSNSFKKYGHDDPFGGAITGWTFTTGTHATWGPTLVNGSGSAYGNQGISHGSQAIGLRYEQTLTKSLTGLTAGKRYKLSYQRHNRQGQNNIQYKVYSGEETNVYLSETVTTDSSEAESNRYVEIVFIPFDTTQSFTLKQLTGGDVSIWFDKFELYEDTGGYSAGSTLYEYPPNEIQTALDNYTLNMDSSTTINGSNFTVTVDGSAYGNGDYIIQTTSNGENDAHNPKNLFDKREDSYYGSYDAFLYNWGASQANAIKYNSNGTPNSSASELVSGVKGEWVSITLPDNIVLTKYYIKDRVNHNGSSLSSYIGNASPLSWKLYGSNDGSSYTEIDSKDDDDTIKNNGAMELNVSPTAGYNQYVLVITKVNNKTWFGLGEFKLFGVSAAAGEDSSSSDGSWVNNNEIANGGHQFQTNADLVTAVDAWITDKTNALITYGEINTWDTSKITSLNNLFTSDRSGNTAHNNFNDDISNWNTSNVTSMNSTFLRCYLFNQDLSTKKVTVNGVSYVAWDTSKVTDFTSTFRVTYRFNQDITNWNTSNATSFERMFRGGATSNHDFNQDISTKSVTVDGATYTAWDTSNITTMKSMFEETSEPDYSHSFKQNIRNWNTANVTDYTNMFRYSSMHLDYTNVSGFGDTPTASFFNQ